MPKCAVMTPKRAMRDSPHENWGIPAIIAIVKSEGNMHCGSAIDLALLIQKRILFTYLRDSMKEINDSFSSFIPPGVG